MQPATPEPQEKLTQSQLPSSNNELAVVLAKGRYVKKHLIGSGSYGSVYLADYLADYLAEAEHLKNNNLVALKIARRGGRIEVNVLSKLNPHRNIVTLLDFSISGDEVCLALELGDCSLDKLVGLWGREKIQLSIG